MVSDFGPSFPHSFGIGDQKRRRNDTKNQKHQIPRNMIGSTFFSNRIILFDFFFSPLLLSFEIFYSFTTIFYSLHLFISFENFPHFLDRHSLSTSTFSLHFSLAFLPTQSKRSNFVLDLKFFSFTWYSGLRRILSYLGFFICNRFILFFAKFYFHFHSFVSV